MNVWPDVRQWIDPFKAGAMTMSWTEDWWWQLPEVLYCVTQYGAEVMDEKFVLSS
jgi:hypothetical protein